MCFISKALFTLGCRCQVSTGFGLNRSLLNMNSGELLFILDPDVRSLVRKLDKTLRKEVHSSYCIALNALNETYVNEKKCIYIFIYIYI